MIATAGIELQNADCYIMFFFFLNLLLTSLVHTFFEHPSVPVLSGQESPSSSEAADLRAVFIRNV